MIPAEILSKIKRLHFHTQHLVNDAVAGSFGSVFRGRGMEFLEVREYQVGDDIRDIDWNVTARSGKPFIKEYREERELTVMLLVDVSASLNFGSGRKTKLDIAAEVAALLAFIAIKNNDKIGAILFTDKVEKFIPPKKGRAHVWRVIREILGFKPEGTGTHIGGALEYLQRVVHHRSICFLVSDFIDQDFDRPLRIAKQRHDVVAVHVSDPWEHDFLPIGFIEIEDAEAGTVVSVNSKSKSFRQQLKQQVVLKENARRELFKRMDTDLVEIKTDQPILDPIQLFLRKRARKR